MDVEGFKIPEPETCVLVSQLKYNERCAYVTKTATCQEGKYFSAFNLYYCIFDPRNVYMEVLCSLMLVLIILWLFLILGSTADKMFCPALKVVATLLRMNEQMAGMTLLAFGNGAPDLFTTFVNLGEKQALLFSNLLGAGILVQSLVGGLICLMYPFDLGSTLIVRDGWFLLLQVVYIDFASSHGVTIYNSVVILFIYMLYIVIAYGDQFLLKRQIKALEIRMSRARKFDRRVSTMYEIMNREANVDIYSQRFGNSVDITYTARMSILPYSNDRNSNLWKQFLSSINPFEKEDWDGGNFLTRFLVIMKVPINLVILLLVPIIDYEADLHGWSKLLNSIQIVTTPTILIGALLNYKMILMIPVQVYVIAVTLPIAIGVFAATRTGSKPYYHEFIAIYTILGAIYVMWVCADLCAGLLDVFGFVTKASQDFLGCTVLGFGNSIGDIVSNLALARTGYQRMGYSACYGGPFFNISFALGVSYIYLSLTSEHGEADVGTGELQEMCFVFFVLIQAFTTVWAMTTGFRVRSSVGIFLLLCYGLFLLYLLLTELEVIQTYIRPAAI